MHQGEGRRAAPTTGIDEVVARLEQIDRTLPPEDGVACFNQMYLTVTRLIRDHLRQATFADPVAMAALDVTFASLYLDAVDADLAGSPVPQAWAPLFVRRADHRLVPIQFALAGMNAHINHDLPLAVVTNRTAARSDPERGSFHADYLLVNVLLARTQQQVRQSYLDGLPLQADREGAPVLNLLGGWSITRARDAAWANALVLWHLGGLPPVRDAFGSALAGSVGLVTAGLLTPVPSP